MSTELQRFEQHRRDEAARHRAMDARCAAIRADAKKPERFALPERCYGCNREEVWDANEEYCENCLRNPHICRQPEDVRVPDVIAEQRRQDTEDAEAGSLQAQEREGMRRNAERGIRHAPESESERLRTLRGQE